MTEVHESLVKEYLELNGYVVKTDTKFKKKNWSDIDIIAVKKEKNKDLEIIVGEVKGYILEDSDIKKINEDLEHENIKEAIKNSFGTTNYKKWVYCWPQYQKKRPKETEDEFKSRVEKERVNYKKDYNIDITFFSEIINDLIAKVRNIREKKEEWAYLNDCPNLMLLQMIHTFSDGRINIKFTENPKGD